MPTVVVLAAATTALLPVLVVSALVVDAVRFSTRRIPFVVSRLVVFGWLYLVTEVMALSAMAALGLATGFGLWRGPFMRGTYGLQTWWAHQLFAALRVIFRARLVLEGEEAITPGPILLFVRHASLADVLLPNVVVTRRHGLRLRYVLKWELLIDPAIDIAGNRLPNIFVRRGTGEAGTEIERVGRLTDNLAADEGVIIYPEGTRFSESKRARILEKLAESQPELALQAQRLEHTLPPRVGGPLALLDSHTSADVVFMAHVGFDGLAEVRDLFEGGLVRATIRVNLWRVPYHEIPADPDSRVGWLLGQWERVDSWIGDQRATGT